MAMVYRHQAGFATKTEARRWFAANVAPRLNRGAPSPDIDFDAFCDLFLDRHGATVSKRTCETLRERLAPARSAFGSFTLRELEGAAEDIAGWRASVADSSRYRLTGVLRQALKEELLPFTRDEVDALEVELGPVYGALVVFAAETELRTNEWVALERRDIDRTGPAVGVQRRVSDGRMTP